MYENERYCEQLNANKPGCWPKVKEKIKWHETIFPYNH